MAPAATKSLAGVNTTPDLSAWAGWQVVEQLHAELLAAQGSIQHLTDVVQTEQERSSEIERAAAADRVRMLRLETSYAEAKARDNQQTQAMHVARKDMAAADAGLHEAYRLLEEHSCKLSIADIQIADLHSRAAAKDKQVDGLNSFTSALRTDVDNLLAASCEQRGDHTSLREAVDLMEILASDLGERHRDLNGAHDQTASSLQQTIQTMIQPAIEQAERERIRLDNADMRINTLSSQSVDHDQRVLDLEGSSAKLIADQLATSDRLADTISSVADLSSGLTSANANAKEDREKLDDAWRSIEHLGQNAIDAQTALRRMQVEVEEIQTTTERHGALSAELADHVRALQHGLEVTDEEVQGVKGYLDIQS